MKVMLKNVRLAFPALWEAKTVNGEGKPAFSAVLLLAPYEAQVQLLRNAMKKVAADKWGAKAEKVYTAIVSADKCALHDGNSKADYDGFADMMYVSARTAVRPLVIDADKTPLAESDGKPYAGCYVNASIELWAQDNNYGKRINASLRGVQFARDGEAFAGSAAASPDEFEIVETPEAMADFV